MKKHHYAIAIGAVYLVAGVAVYLARTKTSAADGAGLIFKWPAVLAGF